MTPTWFDMVVEFGMYAQAVIALVWTVIWIWTESTTHRLLREVNKRLDSHESRLDGQGDTLLGHAAELRTLSDRLRVVLTGKRVVDTAEENFANALLKQERSALLLQSVVADEPYLAVCDGCGDSAFCTPEDPVIDGQRCLKCGGQYRLKLDGPDHG